MAIEVFATAQIPDKLIFENQEYLLHTNPMEGYIKKYPEKKPKNLVINTALYRGYVATFEIINNELFVKDIQIIENEKNPDGTPPIGKWKSIIKEVFSTEESKKVDWFSGILVAPYGKIKKYVHTRYDSTYSKYLLFSAENGVITGFKKLEYRGFKKFKENQFNAFRKTEEYQKVKSDLLEELGEIDEEFFDRFLENHITDFLLNFLE